MKTIEINAVVGDDRKLTLQLPPEVNSGEHQIVVVVGDPPSERRQDWTIDDWPVHDAGFVDPNFNMSREELYGDDAR